MYIPENVLFSQHSDSTLKGFIRDHTFDQVAVLVDEHTRELCLPRLQPDEGFAIIEIQSGEQFKTLDTCTYIWEQMTQLGMSRKSLLVNLGGGVIGDMGGFVASTYKRGMAFVNIPTTLLAQVDASIGGKLAIDFNGLKNHIGVFRQPDLVILDTAYLQTLPTREVRSGYAEIIKHGLIRDKSAWDQLKETPFDPKQNWSDTLKRSVGIKGEVVREDPEENGLRKILNFGHTLGHAIETYFLHSDTPLLHGEAIAIGMVLEGYLSAVVCGLGAGDLEEISEYVIHTYGKVDLPNLDAFGGLLAHDKKNVGGRVNYSLLEAIGKCVWDQQVPDQLILDAIEFYRGL